jgi:hypothetical protein
MYPMLSSRHVKCITPTTLSARHEDEGLSDVISLAYKYGDTTLELVIALNHIYNFIGCDH